MKATQKELSNIASAARFESTLKRRKNREQSHSRNLSTPFRRQNLSALLAQPDLQALARLAGTPMPQ